MENGEEKGLESGEEVVPASKLKEAEARIRDLERALGRKTMENEILHEAVRIGREKNSSRPPNCASWTVENEPHREDARRVADLTVRVPARPRRAEPPG